MQKISIVAVFTIAVVAAGLLAVPVMEEAEAKDKVKKLVKKPIKDAFKQVKKQLKGGSGGGGGDCSACGR